MNHVVGSANGGRGRAVRSTVGDGHVGRAQHGDIVGAVTHGNDPGVAQRPKMVDGIALVEDVVEARTLRGAIFSMLLFYRHALSQIPRLIHVRAAKHRNVIGQQL